MPYLRLPLFVRRVFNPLAMRFGIGGAQALAVAGRRSGRVYRVPVIPVEYGGARYLVSPRGDTDWVRNLRRAGSGELGKQSFRSTEIAIADPPVIEAYRAVAGRAVKSLFEKLPNAEDHPVFRIET